MLVVSRQKYELISISDPKKRMILPRGALTDVPEEFQDHTFHWAVKTGTIQVPETREQEVAAENGEMAKPLSRLTAKEAWEELQRRGIEMPENATKAQLLDRLNAVDEETME